jgi:hypothetical protein
MRKYLLILILVLFGSSSCRKFLYDDVNQISNSRKELSIGDSYQGGVIVYILKNGDIGFDPQVRHGIIAATVDQTSSPPASGVLWQQGTYDPVNLTTNFDRAFANQTEVGTGKNNTNKILSVQNLTGRTFAAVSLCVNYNGAGFRDWFLPSKDELIKIYLAREFLNGIVFSAPELIYWSSSEKDNFYAEAIDFKNGIPLGIGGYKGPGSFYRVRAVRYF